MFRDVLTLFAAFLVASAACSPEAERPAAPAESRAEGHRMEVNDRKM